ncbi:MAG TPA: hypothetical protein VNV66_16065 [Pilimelia sp.]|nr:hypothetical protein [Pilimelia sp.]
MRLDDERERLARGIDTDPDRSQIVRRARRRRAVRLAAAPVLAGLTGLAVALTAQWWPEAARPDPTPAAAPSGPPVRVQATLTPPVDPVALPPERAVGPATLLYRAGDRVYLVTAGGAQYLASAHGPEGGTVSLSPDGRWYLRGGQLRDLTGTTVRKIELSFFHPRAWSPNSRWLLADASGSQYLVEVLTGRVSPVHTPGIAVLDDGGILAADHGEGIDVGDPKKVTLRVLDPATGQVRREVAVDATGVLRGEEAIEGRLGIFRAMVGPHDRILFVVVGAANPTMLGLVASLRDGRILGRVDPPRPQEHWALLGFTGQGVLQRSMRFGSSDAPDVAPQELVAMEPDGVATSRYQLPSRVEVLVPGSSLFA